MSSGNFFVFTTIPGFMDIPTGSNRPDYLFQGSQIWRMRGRGMKTQYFTQNVEISPKKVSLASRNIGNFLKVIKINVFKVWNSAYKKSILQPWVTKKKKLWTFQWKQLSEIIFHTKHIQNSPAFPGLRPFYPVFKYGKSQCNAIRWGCMKRAKSKLNLAVQSENGLNKIGARLVEHSSHLT